MSDLLLHFDGRGFAGIALKVTLLLSAGWCVAGLFRRTSAVMRHTIWLGVIVGAVIVPVLARFGPVELPVLASTPGAPPASVRSLDASDVTPTLNGSAVQPSAATPTVANGGSRWTPQIIALALWFATTLLILARFIAGVFTVRGIARRGRPVHGEAWRRGLDYAARRVDIAILPRVVMSDEVDVAFTCNAFTPTIVLPTAAEEWTDDLRDAVLTHELAHIKRRDLLSQSAATIACAMYWFNPLAWAAARRLRAESEIASDDLVLQSGVRPADYAQHLLNLVTTLRHSAPIAALAIVRPREFEGRLVAILDRAAARSSPDKTRRGAVLGMLFAVTISVGTVVPVPRAPAADPHNSAAAAINLRGVAPASSVSGTPVIAERRGGVPARLSDAAEGVLLRTGSAAVINPMQAILRIADTLALSGLQADSVATLNRSYLVALDKIWRPVLHYYATHAVEDERPADDPLKGAQLASIDVLARLAPHVNDLLSRDQRARLPADVARWLDPNELSALRSRAPMFPDAVIDMPRGPGARVGGGGVVRRPGRGRAG